MVKVCLKIHNCSIIWYGGSMKFGGKPNYTCGIINNRKSSLILPLRLVRILLDSLVFLTMGISKLLRGCR
jgi:hypothetical protein